MTRRDPQRVTLTSPSATFEFDATLRETYTNTTRVTSHPVESGANVADHAIEENRRLHFETVTTNTPIVDLANASPNRMQAFFEALTTFKALKTPVTVTTGLVLHASSLVSFLITELTATRDAPSGDILDMKVGLEEIRFANIKIVPLTDADTKSGKTIDGKKATTAASAAVDRSNTLLNGALQNNGINVNDPETVRFEDAQKLHQRNLKKAEARNGQSLVQ